MPPEFIVDRDLGKRVVAVLRNAGFIVYTLVDVFGSHESAQQAADVDWIEHAGRQGWAALSNNKKIRYNTLERQALERHNVPLFALVNGNLKVLEMAGAYLVALPRIIQICQDWARRFGLDRAPRWPGQTAVAGANHTGATCRTGTTYRRSAQHRSLTS